MRNGFLIRQIFDNLKAVCQKCNSVGLDGLSKKFIYIRRLGVYDRVSTKSLLARDMELYNKKILWHC